MARSLLAAASIIEDGELDRRRDERYAGWDTERGQQILDGKISLQQLHDRVVADTELRPANPSRSPGAPRRPRRPPHRTRPLSHARPAPLVVGVDSSTQSIKVEARDLATGAVVATGTAKHPPTTPAGVRAGSARRGGTRSSRACAQLGDHRRDVVAISVAGQQHGLVLLDAAGEPVRPAKLWNDTTSAPNAERLVARARRRPVGGRHGQRAGGVVHHHQAGLGGRARTRGAGARDAA